MEAQDQDAGRAAEDAEGQASPGNAGNTGGPGGQENPARDSRGEAPNPGPGGNALPGPATTTIRRRRFQFSLIVSFRTPLLAQIARRYLTSIAQPPTSAVQLQLIVSNNVLTLRLTGEDPVQLLIGLSTCLHEFCMMMQTLRRIALPFFPKKKLGKRGLN